MAHIVKVTKLVDSWHIEDRKGRWTNVCSDDELDTNSNRTVYGNEFPFSLCWHMNQAIKNGHDNYFHGTWKGEYWALHGRCNEPKHTW